MKKARLAHVALALAVLPLLSIGVKRLLAEAANTKICWTCTDTLCNGPGCACDAASLASCDPDGKGAYLNYKCRALGEGE